MLKINDNYTIMTVVDTAVVIGKNANAYMPYTLMSLNDTGVFLWKLLENGTDEESLIKSLEENYSLTHEKAQADAAAFLRQLREKNLLET